MDVARSRGQTPRMRAVPVRVMVVDDQPSFLRVAERVLGTDPQVEVVEAVLSAREAWRLLDAGVPVDLALVDLSMPEVNGVEAIARIHRDHPRVTAILMSTYELDELPAVARAADVVYLRKADLSAERIVELFQPDAS